MTVAFPGVALAALLFLAAAVLLRRRSNPSSLAAIGVTLAPLPALFGWFHVMQTMADRLRTISAGAPAAIADSTTRALSEANQGALGAQRASAILAGIVFVISLVVSWRKPGNDRERPGSRSRVVATTAIVALLSSFAVFELGADAILFPLAVVASQQGRADPALPLTMEAAKGLFMDAASQDDVSKKVGDYLGATTIGAVLGMGLCIAGFVITMVTSAGRGFPRSSAVLGLLLALLLGGGTLREIQRHRAIEGEIRLIASRIETGAAAEPPGVPK